MERALEGCLCEACRVRATQKVELVEGTICPSLSFTVVAARVIRARPGGEYCANFACQRLRANGPVFVKKKPLNMCVHNNVSFIGLKTWGTCFNTSLHAKLEFSFHDIFNNMLRQG